MNRVDSFLAQMLLRK